MRTVRALNALPRRIVVAVDFSRAGLRAARAALSVLADGGSLDLVFIDNWLSPTIADWEGDAASHAPGGSGCDGRDVGVRSGARGHEPHAEGFRAARAGEGETVRGGVVVVLVSLKM